MKYSPKTAIGKVKTTIVRKGLMGTSFDEQSSQLTNISEIEWRTRQELAVAYRIFDYMGWAELIFAHLSLRIPGEEEHFLINPYGLLYSEVRASNLVKIDINGNIIDHSMHPFNPAGFVTHGAIHRHVERANCVFHAHTTAGMAVASLESGLSISNIYAAQLYNKLAYHDFEGLTLCEDEGERLINDIGNKPAIIMRNHGLFALGKTVIDAFNIMWLLNRACEVQIAASSMGKVIDLPVDIQKKCTQDSFHFNPEYGAGKEVYLALVREMDRIDPSYKY